MGCSRACPDAGTEERAGGGCSSSYSSTLHGMHGRIKTSESLIGLSIVNHKP